MTLTHPGAAGVVHGCTVRARAHRGVDHLVCHATLHDAG